MAKDKLITVRIEGEKREAFNNLAKSQNTDTASLLYDFISGCLDGRIDIKLVTGKGNRLDKIDNQLDTNRLDKLEATTQRLDHWIGALSERLNDWILRSDRRVNDCEKELSEKITNLEHRLSTLSIQLDSQQIDSIDTDSQLDSPPDMEPLLKREIATSPFPTSPLSPGTDAIETVVTVEAVYNVETADKVETAIDTVESVESDSTVELVTGSIASDKGMTSAASHRFLASKNVNIAPRTLDNWIRNSKIPESIQGKKVQKYLILKDKKYYSIE